MAEQKIHKATITQTGHAAWKVKCSCGGGRNNCVAMSAAHVAWMTGHRVPSHHEKSPNVKVITL